MLKKKKSFTNAGVKSLLSYLFGQARNGGNNNGESDCCNGKQGGSCHDNGNPQCCNSN